MECILITGADGFIGSHLTDFYLNKNYIVVAIKKPNTNVKNLNQYTKNPIHKEESVVDNKKEYMEIPTNIQNLFLLECDLNDKKMLEVILELHHASNSNLRVINKNHVKRLSE